MCPWEFKDKDVDYTVENSHDKISPELNSIFIYVKCRMKENNQLKIIYVYKVVKYNTGFCEEFLKM